MLYLYFFLSRFTDRSVAARRSARVAAANQARIAVNGRPVVDDDVNVGAGPSRAINGGAGPSRATHDGAGPSRRPKAEDLDNDDGVLIFREPAASRRVAPRL